MVVRVLHRFIKCCQARIWRHFPESEEIGKKMLLPEEFLWNDGLTWPQQGNAPIDLQRIDQCVLMGFEQPMIELHVSSSQRNQAGSRFLGSPHSVFAGLV